MGKVIKNKYPWVKLIEPKENTGFAKGNNIGVTASNKDTKYYLFLNTDALIDEKTLFVLVTFLYCKLF